MTGLTPTEGKVRGGGSVFSRLDSDGPVSSSHVSSTPSAPLCPQSPPPATRVTIDTTKDRVAIDTSKPRTIRLGKESKVTASDSKMASRARKTSLAERLGEVSSSRHSEGSGLRSTSSKDPPPLRMRVGETRKSQSDVSSSSGTSVRKSASVVKGRGVPRSMVADEIDYQTQRHNDIRLRLEMKEKAKAARRRGPLEGRLEQHHVFGRLE